MYGWEVDIHYADDVTLLLPRNCHNNATALAVSRPYGCTDPLGPIRTALAQAPRNTPPCPSRRGGDVGFPIVWCGVSYQVEVRILMNLLCLPRMYSLCNPHVFLMYSLCIPHVSSMYLDYLCGYMYPACILHVSIMSPFHAMPTRHVSFASCQRSTFATSSSS